MDEEENLEEQVEPVDVLVEEPSDEMVEEQPKAQENDFFNNLAEDMDDRALTALSSDLITEYKKDKESRADWEKGYTSAVSYTHLRAHETG